jgi:hypothetical protein
VRLVTQYFLKENCVIRGQNSSLFLLKYRNFIAIGDEIWRILSNLKKIEGLSSFVVVNPDNLQKVEGICDKKQQISNKPQITIKRLGVLL